MDYDDGDGGNGIHDVAVRNGGFESPASTVDGVSFEDTDNWQNLSGAQTASARRTNIKDTGLYSSVNSVNSPVYGLDTEHTIAAGDIFMLEFRARRAASSDATSTITGDLFYTGGTRLSANIINTQTEGFVQRKVDVVAAMDELKGLAGETKNALLQGRLEAFGDLLHQAWLAKKRMAASISNPRIDELYQEARHLGALGGKISGAGGGGRR